MKKTSLLLTLLLFTIRVMATNVSGYFNANITWTKANSPYIITGDVFIDTFSSLTIEPGAQVRFSGDYTIFVEGRMSAVGTITDSISFIGNSTSSQGSYLGGSIDLLHSSPTDTCKFQYCHFSGMNGAINQRAAPLKVEHSVFEKCFYGIHGYYSPYCYAVVSDCKFQNNETGAELATNGEIYNCVADYNTNGLHGSHTHIYGNLVHHNSTGILNGWVVEENIIAYNKVGLIGTCYLVKNNQIWYNKTGITLPVGGEEENCVMFNDIGIDGTNVGSVTTVHHNMISNNAQYNFKNGNGYADMSNNYWGDTDSVKIAATILDFFDGNFSLGKVGFLPVLQNGANYCSADISVTDTTDIALHIPGIVQEDGLRVYPNPAQDIVVIESRSSVIIKDAMLYRTDGVLILSAQGGNINMSLNVSDLPRGIYVLKVLTGDGKAHVSKLLKE